MKSSISRGDASTIFKRKRNLMGSKLFKEADQDSKRLVIVKRAQGPKTLSISKKNVTLSYIHFKKKKNIVEQNIHHSDKFKPNQTGIIDEKVMRKRSYVKASDILSIQTYLKNLLKENKRQEERKQTRKQQFLQDNSEYFQPKKYGEILEKYIKNQKASLRNFQQKIKKIMKWKQAGFNRYTYKELSSYYKVLLNYAQGSSQKFKSGFQVILNLSGLITQQSQFDKEMNQIKEFSSFQTFSKLYKHFETYHFKQSIIDALKILFHNFIDQGIKVGEIENIFSQRIPKREAILLSQSFVEAIHKEYGPHLITISMSQIYDICYKDNHLCQNIYEYYLKEMKVAKQYESHDFNQ